MLALPDELRASGTQMQISADRATIRFVNEWFDTVGEYGQRLLGLPSASYDKLFRKIRATYTSIDEESSKSWFVISDDDKEQPTTSFLNTGLPDGEAYRGRPLVELQPEDVSLLPQKLREKAAAHLQISEDGSTIRILNRYHNVIGEFGQRLLNLPQGSFDIISRRIKLGMYNEIKEEHFRTWFAISDSGGKVGAEDDWKTGPRVKLPADVIFGLLPDYLQSATDVQISSDLSKIRFLNRQQATIGEYDQRSKLKLDRGRYFNLLHRLLVKKGYPQLTNDDANNWIEFINYYQEPVLSEMLGEHLGSENITNIVDNYLSRDTGR